MTTLGLLTARTVAMRYGGGVELTTIAGRGSVIQLTFRSADDN